MRYLWCQQVIILLFGLLISHKRVNQVQSTDIDRNLKNCNLTSCYNIYWLYSQIIFKIDNIDTLKIVWTVIKFLYAKYSPKLNCEYEFPVLPIHVGQQLAQISLGLK
jgi:hypothetical protein